METDRQYDLRPLVIAVENRITIFFVRSYETKNGQIAYCEDFGEVWSAQLQTFEMICWHL